MKKLSLVVGLIGVGFVVVTAIVSFLWLPYDPGALAPAHRLAGPSWAHPLGTDTFGRDTLSRIMVGSRVTLMVGVVSVAIAGLIGTPLGILVGMTRSRFGAVILRVVDLLYAFPAVLLAMLLAAAFGGSTLTGVVAIGVATVPVFTRVARSGTMQVMSQDFIVAARASGTPWRVIAGRHVVPNIAPLLGVQASVSFGMAILAEAALSYLGVATPPTTITWGRMLYDAQMQLFNAPALTVWPAVAIVVAVLGFNVLGDALRDLLDPRLRELS